MQFLLIIASFGIAVIGAILGIELGTTDNPVLTGYVGGLVPFACGLLSGVFLTTAICWNHIQPPRRLHPMDRRSRYSLHRS